MDFSYYAQQKNGQHLFLKYPCEHEAFALINLVRVAPIHCANTIFELSRNRYDFFDKSYQEIVKQRQTDIN